MADIIAREFNVPVRGGLHGPSRKGDLRNDHFHFIFPARDLDGKKLTQLSNRRTASVIVAQFRSEWQEAVNAELVAGGHAERLDLSSRAARGLSEACQRVSKREFERARRGEIYSPTYAKNQSIIALREAEAACVNAFAIITRTRRFAIRELVGRFFVANHARRTSRGRTVGPNRTGTQHATRRNPGFRGGYKDDRPRDQASHREDAGGACSVAVAPTSCQRPNYRESIVEFCGITGSDRARRNRVAEPETELEASVPGNVLTKKEQQVRSLLSRAVHWFCGSNRGEVQARTEVTALKHAQQAAEREVHTDSISLIDREDAERSARQLGTQVERVVGGVCVAGTSNLPLFKIKTVTGSQYYMFREDYEKARDQGASDVPLCHWNGQPIDERSDARTRLRLSTVAASELTPFGVSQVQDILYRDQSAEEMSQQRSLAV